MVQQIHFIARPYRIYGWLSVNILLSILFVCFFHDLTFIFPLPLYICVVVFWLSKFTNLFIMLHINAYELPVLTFYLKYKFRMCLSNLNRCLHMNHPFFINHFYKWHSNHLSSLFMNLFEFKDFDTPLYTK